jgi:hypothetical protein
VVAADVRELAASDRGRNVWDWLCQREPARWSTLVAELQPEQRTSLVVHLLCKGHAATTVANRLGLMPNLVRDVWRDYAARIGEELLGITLPTMVGRIESRADELYEMAVEQDRPDRAWKIEKERVELYQSLGLVDRATKRFEVAHTHTLAKDPSQDSETQAEIQRLIALEKKRAESAERVKRIDVRMMDSLPPETQIPKEDDR